MDGFDVIDNLVYTLERLNLVPSDGDPLGNQEYSGFDLVQELMMYWSVLNEK